MTSSDDESDRPDGDTEELRTEIEGLRAALAVARETVEELRAAGSVSRAQSDALRVDLELREDEISSLRSDHRATLARASLIEAELSEAQSSIEANLASLATREREMSLRDAHVAIAERGIEDRDQQLAIFCKQLDAANQQLSLFEGEVQTQRAMLDSARHAITLRDDRIAFLQETLRSLEQLASGAVGAEALPRPQVASIPAPVAVAAPQPVAAAAAPAPAAAEAPAATVEPGSAEPQAAAAAVTPPDGDQSAAAPAVTESVANAVEPAVAERPGAESNAADTEPGVADQAAGETAAAAVDAPTENAPPAAGSEAKPDATEEEEETSFFYKVTPPMIPPMQRYWRDTEIEGSYPGDEVTSVDTLFSKYVEECCTGRSSDTIHIWSLGGGDTQIEVRIAALLKEHQVGNFEFHILDSQPKKLKKQRTMLINGLELGSKFEIHDGAIENWPDDAPCDLVIADGSISSAKEPEAVLDKIKAHCDSGAIFLMTDRIGTAVALPPSAISAITQVYGSLSEKQRKNKLEGAFEEHYVDRRASMDDSTTGRLLALLEARFEFEVKFTGGNLIEALTGPEFGPNFKVKEPDDRKAIDRLAALDRDNMTVENLEPRFLIGVLRKDRVVAPLLLGCAK